MSLYTCLCTHIYTHVYTHVYAYVYTHVYDVYTHVYTHLYTHAYAHAGIRDHTLVSIACLAYGLCTGLAWSSNDERRCTLVYDD